MGTIRPPCFSYSQANSTHAACSSPQRELTGPCPGVRFPELVTAIEMSGSERSGRPPVAAKGTIRPRIQDPVSGAAAARWSVRFGAAPKASERQQWESEPPVASTARFQRMQELNAPAPVIRDRRVPGSS
jgi:hypothetical protein